jgi:hypothetical protein
MQLLKPGVEEDDGVVFPLQITLAESFRYERNLNAALLPFGTAVEAAARHEPAMNRREVEALERLAATLAELGSDAESVRTLQRALSAADAVPAFDATRLELVVALVFAYGKTGEQARASELLARYQVVTRTLRVGEHAFENGILESRVPLHALMPSMPQPPPPQPPRGTPTKSGTISDASRVVAGMRKGFRECYQVGLNNDPQLHGTVRLTLRVDQPGTVGTVSAEAIGLPEDVVDCVASAAGAGQFAAPDGGSAVIQVPVTFVKQ